MVSQIAILFFTNVCSFDIVVTIPAKQKLPQIHRQLRAIRHVMFLFAVIVFFVTLVIMLARPGMMSSDLSLVIHSPLMAALASLPVTAPACLFFLEVLGTARILVKVHPHAYITPDGAHESGSKLFFRYLLATTLSRLYLQGQPTRFERFLRNQRLRRLLRWIRFDRGSETETNSDLICIPPASTFLLEKLGVVTAFTLIDDELACEPYSIPQQLLVPTSNGLKLLDLCPTYETDSDDDSEDESPIGRKRGKSYGSSPSSPDSESDSDDEQRFLPSAPKRKIKESLKRRRRRRKIRAAKEQAEKENQQDVRTSDDTEVQFEDPLWWHFLPSLKCIGLASLLVDAKNDDVDYPLDTGHTSINFKSTESLLPGLETAGQSLVRQVCTPRERQQLQLLARCIGFITTKNSMGERGDLSYFEEKLRVNVISTKLLDARLAMDAHALGVEEARSWGLLTPDSSSVIIQDARTKAYQLLTVGDPRVIAGLCHEAWQGENSTISPLTSVDRAFVVDTSKNWLLSDLDVTAFAYSPVRSTLETRLSNTLDESSASKTVSA
jgi:hypothetical protein